MNDKLNRTSKGIGLAIFIMASSNILSRVLGYLRIKVLAHTAGTTDDMDAFAFSFILPDIINHLLAGSALSITFIPIFQSIAAKKGKDASIRFFSNLLCTGTLFFFAVIILSMIYTEQILFFAGENIKNNGSGEVFDKTVFLTRIILPAQLFFFWGALLNGVQYANKRFLFPAFTPLLYNLGIISGGIFLFPVLGISGFSWGVLAGSLAGNVLMQIPGTIRAGMKLRFIIDLKDKNLHKWILTSLPLVLGLGMTFSNEFLLRFFGSKAPEGEGAIASLNYSYKLFMMIVGLFGQAVAAGSYPYISQLASEKRYEEIKRLISSVLIKVASLTVPISMILFAVSGETITVLLSGGKFDSVSAAMTSKAFRGYLPGAFFCAGVLIITRIFFALKNTLLPLIITTSSVFLCIPFFIVLGNTMGTSGIALSSSISMFISFIAILTAYRIKFGRHNGSRYLKDILYILLTAVLSGGVTLIIKEYLVSRTPNLENRIAESLIILGPSVLAGLICMVFILSITDTFNIISEISRKLRSRSK